MFLFYKINNEFKSRRGTFITFSNVKDEFELSRGRTSNMQLKREPSSKGKGARDSWSRVQCCLPSRDVNLQNTETKKTLGKGSGVI